MMPVKFKRGASVLLPAAAQDGTFYFTTDTRALYIGENGEYIQLDNSIYWFDSSVEEMLSPFESKRRIAFDYNKEKLYLAENDSEWIRVGREAFIHQGTLVL